MSKEHLSKEPENILIILTGALGDIARGFAILIPLKNLYPNAKISWLVDSKWQELTKIHPLIDNQIVFNRKAGIKEFIDIIGRIKKAKFDLTLDLQRNFKSGIFSFSSCSTKRIGFNTENSKELNWLFNTEQIESFPEDRSKVLHYLKFIDKISKDSKNTDLSDLDRVKFGFEEFDFDPHLPSHFKESKNKKIGILLGSSWETKNWPDEYYIELTNLITNKINCDLYLLGDRSKTALSISIEASVLNRQNIINFTGKTNLTELLALISKLSLVTGPDSGPGHLSALVNVPYLGYYGPTLPSRVAPWNCEKLSIASNIGCAGCNRKVCPGLDSLCMKLIRPETVFNGIANYFTYSA